MLESNKGFRQLAPAKDVRVFVKMNIVTDLQSLNIIKGVKRIYAKANIEHYNL